MATMLVIEATDYLRLSHYKRTDECVRTLVGVISAYPYCGQRGTASTRGAVAGQLLLSISI